MFVVFKNEDGAFSVRPAYIGFIKNNYVRRTLCTLMMPFTLVVTILINLIGATLVSFVAYFKSFYTPISKLRPIWKTEIWQRPRTKEDSQQKLD